LYQGSWVGKHPSNQPFEESDLPLGQRLKRKECAMTVESREASEELKHNIKGEDSRKQNVP
jgi:hypothetical protein